MASKGTEFGGQPGRIQPLPHPLTAAEEARLMRAVDPDPENIFTIADQGVKPKTVDEQRVVDAGTRGVGPVNKAGDL